MSKLPEIMIKTYLERRRIDVLALYDSVKSKNIDNFNRIGHQILGNSRNFGFSEIEPIGEELENLKISDIETRGLQLVQKLEAWLNLQNSTKSIK